MKSNTACQAQYNNYQHIYDWINRFDLSKPKKDFKRDFSDGVLLSEVLNYHYPHVLDLNNYISTCNTKQKYANWEVLTKKILRRIKVVPNKKELDSIIMSKEYAIEKFLDRIYKVIFPANYSKVHSEVKGNDDSESESALLDKIKHNQKRINILTERKQSYMLLLTNAQNNVDKLKHELNCLKEQLHQMEQNEMKDNDAHLNGSTTNNENEYSNDDYEANRTNEYNYNRNNYEEEEEEDEECEDD